MPGVISIGCNSDSLPGMVSVILGISSEIAECLSRSITDPLNPLSPTRVNNLEIFSSFFFFSPRSTGYLEPRHVPR